jgi:G3E family GTPase
MRAKKEGVIRSKGFFWLASRPEWIGVWAQAGRITELGPAGIWWAALDRSQWPKDREERAAIKADWEKPWGDRRQELVFIGQNMDQPGIEAGLHAALLTDAEVALGQKGWRKLPDPFDPWELGQEEPADA